MLTNSRKSSSKAKSRNNKNQTSIEAHAETNALVITAQPDVMRSLEKVIAKLDVRRPQVLVEAIILEVFEGDGINLGFQWISEQGGMVQFNNGTVPVGSLAVAAEQAADKTTTKTVIGENNEFTEYDETVEGDLTAAASLLAGVNGMAMGIIKGDWGAIIQAAATDTNTNIISTPSITTMDNQEASMIVGQEIPILTGSAAGSNNSNPFSTVDRQEVGTKLKVTPQINDGSAILLTIEQEVSSISGSTSVDIITNKREFTTTVLADDGGMVILGGLIDEEVQESVSKVPVLGDIPILGHLFKSSKTDKRKRNLMVFIRATIVRDDVTMNKLSHEKYNYLRSEQQKREDEGVSLMPGTNAPVLPEWNDELVLPPTYQEFLHGKNKEEKKDD